MPATDKPFLKRLADGDLGTDNYEPLQLWLLPVFLRSRERYYSDAIAGVQHDVEDAWRRNSSFYSSRGDFDKSQFVTGIWNRASPYWWGLNDIVGFIDIRANVAESTLESSLFLTTKRASRRLTNKIYLFKAKESVTCFPGQNNTELLRLLDDAVTRLTKDSRLRQRHVNLDSWRRVLIGTNIVQIIDQEIERQSISNDPK